MSSLAYRESRIAHFCSKIGGRLVTPLIIELALPEKLYRNIINAAMDYIRSALHLSYDSYHDDTTFCLSLEANRLNRRNVTPNGAVVPKLEYALEYNRFIKAWCDLGKFLKNLAPTEIRYFRLTPNVRVKFSEELTDNVGRGLNTSIPHSDAWVEGPWGFNFHIPLLGDTERNFLRFYHLKSRSSFSDEFLTEATDYNEKSWVLDHYTKIENFTPLKGCAYFSDYAAIHDTHRRPGATVRVSIDSTIMVGNHEIHKDRIVEYVSQIPEIGSEYFIRCLRSEDDSIAPKKSAFSHYTTGNLEIVSLLK